MKGVVRPHPFPCQLRLTEPPGPSQAGRMCKTSRFTVSSSDELCRRNRSTVINHKNQDQPQTTKSVGQSPELEGVCEAWLAGESKRKQQPRRYG